MQERIKIGEVCEYPGSYACPDYMVKCPECGQMVEEYGEVSTIIDGDEHYLCIPCGKKVS